MSNKHLIRKDIRYNNMITRKEDEPPFIKTNITMATTMATKSHGVIRQYHCVVCDDDDDTASMSRLLYYL